MLTLLRLFVWKFRHWQLDGSLMSGFNPILAVGWVG